MSLKISLKQTKDCGIVIYDENSSKWEPEDLTSSGTNYKLSEVYLHAYLVYNPTSGSEIGNSFIREIDVRDDIPYEEMVPCFKLSMPYDGYYTVYYLNIPKLELFDGNFERYGGFEFDGIYASDGVDIYKNESNDPMVYGNWVKIDPLLAIAQNINAYTNIEYCSQELFSTCKLNKCYLKYIYNTSFDKFGKVLCHTCTKEDNLNNIKRLVGDALFVIEGLLEDCLYMEAQYIIEQIMACNGLCPDLIPHINSCGRTYSAAKTMKPCCGG